MAARISRKLTHVVAEVELELINDKHITRNQLNTWRALAQASPNKFPLCSMVKIDDLHIDYEVQRDVIHKHISDIMKKWDARVCSPGSACGAPGGKLYLYDAQHRTIAAALLGFKEIPCAIVYTTDPNFASDAFELLNDTGVKRLTPGDLHRNALVRYKNGSRDTKSVNARTMQNQFDMAEINLQDKKSRKSTNLRGEYDYFFSHFNYAQKVIEHDRSGKLLFMILTEIKDKFPLQDEIDQGVFIGLYELYRLVNISPILAQPAGWMGTLLTSVKKSFNDSSIIHSKAKAQWEYSHPGAGWAAPVAMSNFMREIYILNGGTLNLPYHGAGSTVGIVAGNIVPGLFPMEME